MQMPEEVWLKVLILIAAILVGSSIPLGIISLVRRHFGKEIHSIWVKYALWFVMVPVFVIPMFFGAKVSQVLFLVMSLYSFEEYARAVGLVKERAHMWIGRICITFIYIPVFINYYAFFMSTPAYVIIVIFLVPILRDQYKGMILNTCLTIFGVIYFGWFLGHLAYLMNIDTGRQLILAFMLIMVTNDASAYIIGSNLGRHKMAPNLSPNKTWEGAIGAVLVATGVTVGLRFALYDMAIPVSIVVGICLALGGICGDLSISLIKRDVNIKDAGNIIPGHGGLLDRLNSILFIAPSFFHFMHAFYMKNLPL